MRRRLGIRVKPARPCPLHLEWLEDRRVLSAVAAALDSPPATPAPQASTANVTPGQAVVSPGNSNGQDQDDGQDQDNGQGQNNGHGQDNDPGNGCKNGLGDQVSTWTHEGIHGTELAALIHQAQEQRNNCGSPPTVNPGGPPGGLTGNPGGSASGSGSGSGGTVLGNPPPATGPSGSTGSDQQDSSSGSARDRQATALPNAQAPTVSSHASSSEEAASDLGSSSSASSNGTSGLAAAVNAAIFSQSSAESVSAPTSSVSGPVVVSASTAVSSGNLLALNVFTSGHALTASGASDVALFPAVQGMSTQSLKQAEPINAAEGLQAANAARAASAADGVEAAPVAAVQPEGDLLAVPAVNPARLGEGFRGFLQRLQDLFGRLAKSPTFVAIGAAVVALGGILFEVRRRHRRARRLARAVPTLADPDSDLCLPDSGGSSSVNPS